MGSSNIVPTLTSTPCQSAEIQNQTVASSKRFREPPGLKLQFKLTKENLDQHNVNDSSLTVPRTEYEDLDEYVDEETLKLQEQRAKEILAAAAKQQCQLMQAKEKELQAQIMATITSGITTTSPAPVQEVDFRSLPPSPFLRPSPSPSSIPVSPFLMPSPLIPMRPNASSSPLGLMLPKPNTVGTHVLPPAELQSFGQPLRLGYTGERVLPQPQPQTVVYANLSRFNDSDNESDRFKASSLSPCSKYMHGRAGYTDSDVVHLTAATSSMVSNENSQKNLNTTTTLNPGPESVPQSVSDGAPAKPRARSRSRKRKGRKLSLARSEPSQSELKLKATTVTKPMSQPSTSSSVPETKATADSKPEVQVKARLPLQMTEDAVTQSPTASPFPTPSVPRPSPTPSGDSWKPSLWNAPGRTQPEDVVGLSLKEEDQERRQPESVDAKATPKKQPKAVDAKASPKKQPKGVDAKASPMKPITKVDDVSKQPMHPDFLAKMANAKRFWRKPQPTADQDTQSEVDELTRKTQALILENSSSSGPPSASATTWVPSLREGTKIV